MVIQWLYHLVPSNPWKKEERKKKPFLMHLYMHISLVIVQYFVHLISRQNALRIGDLTFNKTTVPL